MDNKKLFEQYYSRLTREGLLKAFIIGIIVGFAVDFAIALVIWFVIGITGIKWLWIFSIIVGLIVCVVTALILYFRVFRPDIKKVARRLDSMGLENRLITMIEFENDASYIALRQREDAKEQLHKIDTKAIKFVVARSLIIVAAIVFVVGLSMTTVSALSAYEILPPPPVPEDVIPESAYITISYMVDGGGYIDGEPDQLVLKGETTTSVIAVAEEGWAFMGWDDGYEKPERFEADVQEDKFLTAIFVKLNESDSGEGGDKGDQPDGSDAPPNEDGEGNGQNNNNGNNPNGAGGRYEPSNKIIDGETPYQDRWDEFYEAAMQELLDNNRITDEQRAVYEAYFESLKAGVDSSNDQ